MFVWFASRIDFPKADIRTGKQIDPKRFKEVFGKMTRTSISALPQTMSVSLGTPQQAPLVCYDAHH